MKAHRTRLQKFDSLLGITKPERQRMRTFWLPWWAVLCLIAVSTLVSFQLDGVGRYDLARPLLFTVVTLGLVITFRWRLRRHAWFWITLAVIAALHVAVITSVSWRTEWVPAAALTGLAVVDLYTIFVILALVGRFVIGDSAFASNDG